MRTLVRVSGFVGLTLALTFGIAGLVGVNPVFADHTPDDVVCPVTHCVQASDLGSGDLTNFVEDGGFERTPTSQLPASKSWPNTTGTPAWQVTSSTTACNHGTRCALRTGSGTSSQASLGNATQTDVRPGDKLFVSGFFRSSAGTDGLAGLNAEWTLANGTRQIVAAVQVLPDSAQAWQARQGTVTAPANAVSLRIVLFANHANGAWTADSLSARRLITTTMINPGAVNGALVADGSLTLADLLLSSIDTRYPTRTELTGGTPNTAGNPVSWGRLYNMPTAFADGVDNTSPKRYTARHQQSSVGICSTLCDMLTLSLPAGTYSISAKLIVYTDGQDMNVTCTLGTDALASSSHDSASVFMPGQSATTTLPLQLDAPSSAATVARVKCTDGPGAAQAYNIVLTAVAVS
jgi:hypothetical protein